MFNKLKLMFKNHPPIFTETKKICIQPIFNEYPFLKHQIDNVCEIIEPTHFILIDGMFPKGPENTMHADSLNQFKKQYTLDGKGKHSFDLPQVEALLETKKKDYPNTHFILAKANYHDLPTSDAYYKSYTLFDDLFKMNADDIILPLEADVFFHENDKTLIQNLMNNLKPNQGAYTTFTCFFESPSVLISNNCERKIFFKWGTGHTYKKAMKGNFNDSYQALKNINKIDLRVFHYEWLRDKKYLTIRIDQLKETRPISFSNTITSLVDKIESNQSSIKKNPFFHTN